MLGCRAKGLYGLFLDVVDGVLLRWFVQLAHDDLFKAQCFLILSQLPFFRSRLANRDENVIFVWRIHPEGVVTRCAEVRLDQLVCGLVAEHHFARVTKLLGLVDDDDALVHAVKEFDVAGVCHVELTVQSHNIV